VLRLKGYSKMIENPLGSFSADSRPRASTSAFAPRADIPADRIIDPVTAANGHKRPFESRGKCGPYGEALFT
jgi:hypothetical protein